MIKKILAVTMLFVATTSYAQTDATAAKAKVNTSAEAWLKKNAAQYVVCKDTVAMLDSSESCEIIFDFEKDVAYKLAVILSGEPNVTLQVDDATIGAEVYAPGAKDEAGNTIAESPLTVTENSSESIKVITIAGGISMPCRYLILKKKK